MTKKRDNGFTLIELLVTMVVVVVLLAAGVPSFKQFVKNNRVSGQAGKLIIALQVARSEAVKRGSGTVICASTDQLTCSASTDWSNGWITYSDLDQDETLDGNGRCSTQADHLSRECILRVNAALDSVSIKSGVSQVNFRPNGRISNIEPSICIQPPISAITFTLKADNCEYQQQRCITVTAQGHVSNTKQDCS